MLTRHCPSQPSLTPNADAEKAKEVKLQTLCQAAHPAHPLSLKQLTSLTFTEDDSDPSVPAGQRGCICPVCRKGLSNNTRMYALRPCGHVICLTCYETLVLPTAKPQCAHCDVVLDKGSKAALELKREGTGYAAGGVAEAKRFDLPFQG